MRREGYELSISPPTIVTTICEDTNQEMEPFEEVSQSYIMVPSSTD